MRINRLSRILKKAVTIKAVLKKEIKEKEYHPQEDYGSCQERAEAMWADASKASIKMLTVAIARHRMEKHGEDRASELAKAEEGLTDAQIVATTRSSWWRG